MALFRTNPVISILKYRRHFSVLCKNVQTKEANNQFSSILRISQRYLFWEKDRKGGYKTSEQLSNWEHMKNGFKELKQECKLFAQEMKELFESDPIMISRPGETDVLWCFDRPDALNKFVTTCDSDHNEGYSSCKFEMSSAGRGLFHGYLDTRVPKDGKIKSAGYAAIRSVRLRHMLEDTEALFPVIPALAGRTTPEEKMVLGNPTLLHSWVRWFELKSFKRAATYDWHIYNTLVLKVRGDGRSYLLNISTEGYHDIMWNDIYHYVLYTRGGPYWQLAKIPFSKFVLGSKGRLQDKQNRFQFDRVTHFGISCGDKIDGRFNLEVEYVGLEFDPTHEEEFAYEMYKTDKFIVGV